MRIQRGVRSIATVGVTAALTLALVAGPARADVTFQITPHSGPPGTIVHTHGTGLAYGVPPCGFSAYEITFDNPALGRDWPVYPDHTGAFHLKITIPHAAARGESTISLYHVIMAHGYCVSFLLASRHFLVT